MPPPLVSSLLPSLTPFVDPSSPCSYVEQIRQERGIKAYNRKGSRQRL
jgi:hypothetical protein